MKVKILLIFLTLYVSTLFSQTPQWAQKQLELRGLLDQCVDATQDWLYPDGRLYYYLNPFKYDDEQEIFYFWPIYYLYTGDESVFETVKGITLTYFNRTENDFVHGYYPEPFFDTEHTLEGLVTLASATYLKPDDPELVGPLEDLVEHCGNWVPGYAEWFNPETKLMKSIRPGTVSMEETCETSIDWVYNLSWAKLALSAYYATGNERYLNWVGDYLDGWRNAVEINEQLNGYYVFPASVNPDDGTPGPCSGVWYYAAYEPGWGWDAKGNNTMRDIRGPFLDYYRITHKSEYLYTIKNHMKTLFDNAEYEVPALKYDGTQWIAGHDKTTNRLACETSLLDPLPDQAYDDFIAQWGYYYQEDNYMWRWRKLADENAMMWILNSAVDRAGRVLTELNNLTELPTEPDDFPMIDEFYAIATLAFGGITPVRGEMPWTEVMYYKADGSIGLDPGVAVLVEQGSDDFKTVLLHNSNAVAENIKLQANFIASPIAEVYVDDVLVSSGQTMLADVQVPANQTIRVKLKLAEGDFLPPLPPTLLSQVSATEHTITMSWQASAPAEDGDGAISYSVYRNGSFMSSQDSLTFRDSHLDPSSYYTYQVLAIDDAGNKSDPVENTFSTLSDTIAPVLVDESLITPNHVKLKFSEKLNDTLAVDMSNYRISPHVDIDQIQLDTAQRIVSLLTQTHVSDSAYTVTIKNIQDKSGNEIEKWQYGLYSSATDYLEVSNISQAGYTLLYKSEGDSIYSDRTYVINFISDDIQGLPWIETANNDKYETATPFLSFDSNVSVEVLVGYDNRLALPDWMSDWTETGNYVISEDETHYQIYEKLFSAGTIALGGNDGVTSSSMYIVLLQEIGDPDKPTTPLNFQLGSIAQ